MHEQGWYMQGHNSKRPRQSIYPLGAGANDLIQREGKGQENSSRGCRGGGHNWFHCFTLRSLSAVVAGRSGKQRRLFLVSCAKYNSLQVYLFFFNAVLKWYSHPHKNWTEILSILCFSRKSKENELWNKNIDLIGTNCTCCLNGDSVAFWMWVSRSTSLELDKKLHTEAKLTTHRELTLGSSCTFAPLKAFPLSNV